MRIKLLTKVKVAAEAIAGEKSVVDYLAIPAVCFTDPEMATVGLNEATSKRTKAMKLLLGNSHLQQMVVHLHLMQQKVS